MSSINKYSKSQFIISIIFLISINTANGDYCIDPIGEGIGCTGQVLRTLEEVNNLNLLPGDRVYFKRGEVWRGQLDVTWSGTEANPISFLNYGTHKANPLIKRTLPPAWWQYSIVEGGFEKFINNIVDSVTPNFTTWDEHRNHDLGTFVTADANNAYLGDYAVKLDRTINSGSVAPIIKTGRLPLAPGADFYVRFFAKTEEYPGNFSDVLTVRIRDDRQDPEPDLWWDPLTHTWTTQVVSTMTVSATEYQEFNFTFTTAPDSEVIDLRFEILRDNVGAAWIDEVVVVEGKTEPDKKIWAGVFPDVGVIQGIIDDGFRVAVKTNIIPELLNDREFLLGTGGRFYFRNDLGVPVNAEAGRYMNAIRVHGQHDVIIDGIDVMGPGARDVGLTTKEAGGIIFITPGSYNVVVKNLTTSLSNSIGLDAGIFHEAAGIFSGLENPYGILYENIDSHSNGSTGIYLRGSGVIRNSTIHENGSLAFDHSDKGGIGLQQGPTTVEGNEVYTVGYNGNGIGGDAAIHICCPVEGQFVVRGNYIHDLANGGVILHNDPLKVSESHNFGHIIEYNIISGYGVVLHESENGSIGADAGIKVRHLSGTTIRNNIIGFGGISNRAVGIALLDVVHDTSIYNNVFLHNTKHDFHIAWNADYSGLFSDNNIYFRSDYLQAWQHRNDFYNSLDEWRAVTQQDGQSLTDDPLFVNPFVDDFHLLSGSPAIDAGLYLGQTVDYDGYPIIADPDIGVFEQQDIDNDGVVDLIDNCRGQVNPDQLDLDNDGVGDVCDGDADGDGYVNLTDCDDLNPLIYPGALEISYDQIDQNCDGSDATIVVTKATYNLKSNKLIVIATSELNQSAELTVEGFGNMLWVDRKGIWRLKLRAEGDIPETLIITGVEGSIQTTVQ